MKKKNMFSFRFCSHYQSKKLTELNFRQLNLMVIKLFTITFVGNEILQLNFNA